MTLVSRYQSSFVAGEISPFLFGRSDVNSYKDALQQCVNYIPMVYGGLTKRPGFKYIAALADMTATARLQKFIFSSNQSYQLEFSNLKLRFYKDQGLIAQARTISNGTFASFSGWTDASTGGGSAAASGGKLALTAGGGTAKAVADVVANYGVGTYTVTCDIGTATTTWRVGTTSGGSEIGTGTLTTGTGKTFSFTPTTNGNMYLSFQNTSDSTVDNIVISTPAYTIDTPYATADIPDLRFAQSFDKIVIVHPSYAPRELIRLGHDNWTLSAISFDEPAYLDENSSTVTLTPSGLTGSITVTASSATFASTDVGRVIRYKAGPDGSETIKYGGSPVALNGTQTNFNIPFYPQGSSDLDVYKQAATGVYTLQANPADYTISGGQVVMGAAPGVTDAIEIRKKNAGSGEWGWMTITAYTSSTQVTATVNRTLSGTNASTTWRLGAWSATTGYPELCTFHQQRLVLAKDRTVWCSGIGDLYNFSPDNALHKDQIDADTGFYFDLDRTSQIQWIKSIKDVIIAGTLDNIQSIANVNLGISGVVSKIESSISCAFVEPEVVENEIAFIELNGKRVYAVGFVFTQDGYIPTNMTLLAEHITGSSTFVELTYADLPGKVLWVRKANGSIVSCTYVKNQGQTSWARHTIGGTDVEVESISTIPGATYSELWICVKRTINGGTKRYIECQQAFFNGQDKEDAFFVDSGLTYDSTSTSTITGLDHLEGQVVSLIVDGAEHPTRTVASGSINLQDPAEVVQVGLYSPSLFETVAQDGGQDPGALQATMSRTWALGVHFNESLGCSVGYDADNLTEVLFRNVDEYYGTGPDLKTGFVVQPINSGFQLDFKGYVTSLTPVPNTILSLVFKATVNIKQQ